MALNYSKRLQNLQERRFDPDLQKSILTESFRKVSLPEDLKYLAESMVPIEKSYNEKTTIAANNVKTHLERELTLSFSRDYKYQGSVMTQTNIKTYSDIDLLTPITSYHYCQGVIPEEEKYKGNPEIDIHELRKQIVIVLKKQYDEVDDSGKKSISIYNKNLKRKVDIVPCYYFNTEKYQETTNEYYRGVYLYNFELNKKETADFPFAHMHNVNNKGDLTLDGSRKAIRLVKTLKADSENRILLTSFELTTIVHSIENIELLFTDGGELKIAENVASNLNVLITDENYRKGIKSPNGTEQPLAQTTVEQLKELKKDLDQLIIDCRMELRNNYFEKGLKDYNRIK